MSATESAEPMCPTPARFDSSRMILRICRAVRSTFAKIEAF